MNLIQYTDGDTIRAGIVDGGLVHPVKGSLTVLDLAMAAIEAGESLSSHARAQVEGEALDYDTLADEGRLASPIHHGDPAHLHVTGTGLTHLGSADARANMHAKLNASPDDLTDSMKLFRMGIDGGKPAPGEPGVQPEWFYKGDGSIVAAPGAPLISPDFALDGGEEPEIAGIYVIGPDGRPWRLGFALGNEFSDHKMEQINYLYLAHSKLRPCSVGPELMTDPLPASIEGVSRILRGGEVIWEKPFLSGEENMCHTIENLEAHHFKYVQFLRPGDVHVHFFGTATLSFADKIEIRESDVMEIAAPVFGRPLRNPVSAARPAAVTVKPLG